MMSSKIEALSPPTYKHTYTPNSKLRQNDKMDKKPQKNVKIKSHNLWQYFFLKAIILS